ncbi:MAG: RdgB/HAM1 family non-canonical purine NTP pyrophosphatase [Bacteroidales bacterium]|nr:RdgB/HAM1 family non-canonical purine NTP pyrophosphatase [Bacteroidales bacterium]MBQ7017609.1 RdgB/HAM1 family non-canonical purine NTP pyrophosphatase [Bacteroidales bacterium]MBR2477698.1 RdgB/HAM1 family non-canonical purine NTP pyrophosphatase [Bacteroidales bacterium]
MEIIFATGNTHKAVEAQKALGDSFTLIMPKELGLTEEIPENGDTLQANAIEKAEYLWKRFGKNCFADDTGLEVDALGGAPGVYSARYAGPDKGSEANMTKLLAELEAAAKRGETSRKARFRTVVALILEGEMHLFNGVLEGEIALQRSGSEGFGYDPLFIPDGYTKTLAEISLDEKNAISHRGKAMRALAEFLRCLPKAR